MRNSRFARLIVTPLLAGLVVSFFLAGCSDDDDTSRQPNPQNPGDAGNTAPDPFNGDCTTARWSKVSDACWSCMCGACASTLNACDATCATVFECSMEKGTLVNVGAEIQCEIRAVVAECLTDPASQGAAGALINFDTCLITAPKQAGFRVCEDVCQIPYPGDVCTRYPQ
jgi:hypothetical protein